MTASLKIRSFGAWLAMLVAGACLAGCGSLVSGIHADTFKPYVAEVVQGNFVSKEQRQAVRPGMTRAQVREILGTPLVASLFHADRWDYAFSIKRQGIASQNYRLTVLFKGDALEQITGDDLPSESEFVGRLVKPRAAGKVPDLQASEEALKKFPVSKPVSAETRPAQPLPATYPPLEPATR